MRADEFVPDTGLAAYVEEIGASLAQAQRAEVPERIRDTWDVTISSRAPEEWGFGSSSIYGAAIVGDAAAHAPALLVDRALTLDRGVELDRFPLGEADRVHSVLERIELSVDPSTLVIPIGVPRAQFAPGGLVRATGFNGTFGARVRSAAGEEGVFTAGHVASKGSLVHDVAGHTGTIVFSVDPAQVPALRVTADIAVVVPVLAAAEPPPLYSGTGRAEPGTPVTVFGAASGVQQAEVMGLVTPSLFVPGMSGQWATPYMLTRSASKAGDSGAPVIRSDSGELIGHVVGGDETTTTFVQSIDVQMDAANAIVL